MGRSKMTLDLTLTVIFWGCLGTLAYTFAGYPFLMFLLARFRRKGTVAGGTNNMTVSVVLASYNEQERILPRIQNLLSSTYPTELLEIIIVSDGSTDQTVEKGNSLNNSRIKIVEQQTRSGKAACLNVGLKHAVGEVIVFADMRQRFEADTIQRLVSHFADSSVGAVSGALEIEKSTSSVGGAVDAYWKLEKFIRRLEATYDSSIGCTGAVYAIRRSCFVPIPADTILDDVVIPMTIALKGSRVLFDSKALAYDPQTLEPEREKIRKQRTLAGNFQMMFRYPAWCFPWINRLWWQLISHKYLRLAAPILMVATFVANAFLTAPFYRLLFLGQCGFYCLAFLGRIFPRTGARVLSLPAGFVFLNLMTLHGLYHHLRGSYRGGAWPIAQKIPSTEPARF